MFRDESNFKLFGSDGRKVLWIRVNTEFHGSNLSKYQTQIWDAYQLTVLEILAYMDTTMD